MEIISGIPVYSKDELREIPPELGQRYAVRDPGGIRGPYEIVWLQNGAYRGIALHDVPDFPYTGPPEAKAVDPERMKEINQKKKR